MKLHDVRNPDFFWAQNELFDVFAPLIGVHGVVVYMAICRLLPHRSDGRLTLRDIQEQSGVSKTEVSRARDALVALGMIVERKSAKAKSPSAFELSDLKAAAQVPLEELQRRLTHTANNQRPSCDEPSATTTESVPEVKVGADSSVPPRDRFDANRQCLRGSPGFQSVPPRDRLPFPYPDLLNLSPGGTDSPNLSLPRDRSVAPSKLFLNTTTTTERENAGAREASTALDTATLAGLIVLAHPHAVQRQWTQHEVLTTDRVAAVEAMRAEAERAGCSTLDAGLEMLARVERIAREVPREQWGFLKKIDRFLRLREYRMEPAELYRKGGTHVRSQQDRQHPASEAAATQRGTESRTNIAAALERRLRRSAVAADGGDAGAVSEPGAAGGDAGHVPGGVGTDGGPVRAA